MFKKSLLLTLLLALLIPWAVAQQSLPYSYGFEDNDLSIDGWTTQNPSGLNASEFGINENAKKTGNYGFRFSSYDDSGTSTQYLISPELSAPKGVNVSFYYKSSSTSSSGEKFKVGYSTTNTDVSSFLWSDEYSTSSTSWSQLPEFNCPAGTKYIAIYYYPNYQYRLYIDDISLNVPPSCMKPTGLAATLTPGIGTVATLDWIAGGEETAWVLEYGTTSDFTGATSVNVNGTPTKDLTGLTAETKYYARVKADCGGGDTSNWSATCEFTPTSLLVINILGATSSTYSYLPSNTNYDYSYTQQIYTATEMGGFPCTLKSVAFKGDNAAVCYMDIYLANTTKSSFSGTSDYININDATLVFSGEVTFTANDWKTIAFDNEFDYEGGNIAVIVDDNSGNYDYNSTTWQTFNATGQALYFYQDNTNINPSSPSAGYRGTPSVKNQIKLGYVLPSPYQKPKNLAVTNITNNSATLTWEAPNSDVQSYKYQYREAGGSWSALTSTTALSAPLTSLTGNTTYEFQVQAIYAGDNESGFASKSFTTLIAIPYEYGFEDATEFNKWETADCEDDITNGLSGVVNNTDYAHSGDNFFAFSSYNGATDPQYLISPALSGIANGLHVSFYYRSANNNDPETFMVGYSTTDTDPDSFTWSDEVTCPDGSYYPYAVNFMVPEIKYIAVKYTTADSYYLFVDDFTFEEAPDCLEPTNVIASNITTTSADITWTNGGSETSWDIFATDDSTIVPDGTTTPTVEGVTTKPHQLTLQPGTTYYVYVRAACSSTETSAWSSPAVFHTNCEGMDLPYGPYGFEDGALTVCWNLLSTNTAYNTMSINTNTSYVHTGSKSLLMHSGSYTGDFVLALPIIDDSYSLSDYRFVFWAMAANTDLKVTIGIMEDPNDMTTFVAQNEEFNPASEFTEYKVPFSGYTGDGQYVAIKVSRASGSSSGNVYFDDIAIELTPSCIEPSGLTVSNETAHGATFSWTNGGSETEWHLYFGKNNTAPADDIDLSKVTVANSNPFTMTTGLDPETDYYVWVRANCGSTDGYSMWVGPETFTTGIACPAPTGLTASEVTNHTAKLSWTGTSESYNVWYRTAATMSNPIFSETFETSSLPTGWDRSSTALTDDVLNGTTTINSYSGGWVNTSYGLGQYNWKMNIYSTGKYWLITPSITLDAKNTLNFNAAITAYNSNNAPTSSNMADGNSRFVVLITTDNQATWTILREWNNTGSADVLNNISNTGNNFSIDLTAYAGETVKIAFYGGQTSSGPDCDLHIDNVVIGTPVEAGEWTKKTADASPYEATGLLAETKYEAQVQGNCGSEGTSQWTSSVFFTTDIACPAPTGLAASNATSSSFDLSWTNGGSEDWIVAYKKTTDADFTEKAVNISQVTVEASLITYTLSGLEAETEYTVKVRDNCEASYVGDGMSEWTAEVPYSTIAACSALNPVVDPASITHHNATVTWEGESASGFTVKYREAEHIDGISEEFSGTSIPTNWTMYTGLVNNVIAGSATLATTSYGWTMTTASPNVFNSNHIRLNIYGSSRYHWLVTPEIELAANSGLSFDLALTAYDSNGNSTSAASGTCDDERFVVLIFANNAWEILREWNNDGTGDAVYNNIATAGENVNIDLSSYSGTVKIAFYGESTTSGNGDNDMHLDNVVIGVNVPAATTWQTQTATTTTADLTGLTAGTKYDLKVVPNCDATLESTTIQFTTMSANEKQFITAGDWATATNWLDGEMPTIADNAVIKANATINNGTVATANNISFQGSPTPTLTIENGAQLKHNNTSSINATVKKTITGYGTANANTNNGYVLFAPPFGKYIYTNNSDGTGLRNGTYDLYTWNRTNDQEWTNYGSSNNNSLYMSRGTGYLYASQDTREITFTGSIYGSGAKSNVSVSYTAPGTGTQFSDWNLIGNPFVCNAYLATEDGKTLLAYYKMNDDGNSFTAVSNGAAIASMQGIFYQATANGSVYFFRELPSASVMPGNLNINVAQVVNSRDAQRTTDNAIIRFGEGNTLEKFSFNENNAKVYIPQDGKDYAVVNAANEGEMPVYFKAAENGNYSISFNAENVEFSYLHLIDNLTGNEVNLLETPSYSFDARTIDYASRFKLVFVTGQANMGDDFGFFDANGNLMILGIEGTATLQMIDVTGRIISSETFSGNYSKAINAKAGVYMLRLIQGNDVRTQKIVVR